VIIKHWNGIANDGEIHEDPYIPVALEFPLDEYKGGGRFYCEYLSSVDGSHLVEGRSLRASLLELVIEEDSGRLCRLVLVGVERSRYRDHDPGPVLDGDPVFDLDATLGHRLTNRDRVIKGHDLTTLMHQYEQYELWVGRDRLTILFEGRATKVAVRVGAHLIVFVDQDQEVCGFQITGVTPDQRAKIIDTITYTGKVIEGEDTFSG